MKDLVWDRLLSVDVPEIDEDHRRLVDLFNILSHAVAEGDSPEYVDAVMEELVTCTAWHFRHEERLMIRHRFQGFAEHKAEHAELIAAVRALQEKLRHEGKTVVGDDLQYLERWLTGHILGIDKDLGAYLCDVM